MLTNTATANINNAEQQPLVANQPEEPRSWASLLISIEGFLIVLFIIYMVALYLELL
jgi:hypothetical protein